MASQTKVEPVERSTVKAPSSSVGVSLGGEDAAADRSAPESSIEASPASVAADDEDVSLDELMMSDSSDGDVAEAESPASEESAPLAPLSVQSVEATRPADEAVAPPVEALDPEDDEAAALAAAAAAQEAAAQAAAAEADERAAAARRAAEYPAPPRPAPALESKPDLEARPSAETSADLDAEEPRTGQVAAVQAPLPPPPVAALVGDDEPEAGLPPAVDLRDAAFEAPAAVSVAVPSGAGATAPASEPLAGPARHEGPLPSFDIPEVDPTSRRRLGSIADEPAVQARPLATPLSHLSEVAEEDDDDAVTHIGLPVVPESNDYSALGATGFQVAEPGALAMQGFEPDLSLADARRATTRVLPRIDPEQLPQRRATMDTNPSLGFARRAGGVGSWLSGVFRRYRPEPPRNDIISAPAGRSTAWLFDAVLPPLSLVLFGSGIGAGIMLLLQPERPRVVQTQAVQALERAPATKRPVTLEERAEAGEGDALFKITNMPPNERSSALTLALERGHQAQKQNEFSEFQKSIAAPSGLSKPNLSSRFLGYATSPETMLPAFTDLLGWPGSTGPEVLYTVWEKAPGGSRAASLAQQLLHSEDQRSKATPALRTALDLRSATSCEDYLAVLPAVQRDGDQRCSATLRALKHRDGCGDDGQKDCYACLREGTLLDDALSAIEKRVPPQL